MATLKDKFKVGGAIAGVCLAVGTAIILPAWSYFPADTVTTKINDVEIKRYGKNDKYLVFTDDGVFENTSAWYRGKWSSSDMQNELVKLKGKQVELQKYGWRVRPLSWYENIVKVTPAPLHARSEQ